MFGLHIHTLTHIMYNIKHIHFDTGKVSKGNVKREQEGEREEE